ncbi:MAG: GGDEF domain-containing protein [Colwellia sp.]|uniref:GGDEF domain-containing protein n=1 Tax=Colwellia sp. TaxID=56799 RepID=UPI001E03CFC6|nr:GGDEF domain-containing protein [Colwellia sp.]NQY48640.1 GGDEF domain-containing protein [Colwellia sp.]
MKMINPSLLIILLMPLFLPSFSLAKESSSALVVTEGQDNKNKLLHLAAVSVLPINAELLALMTQLRQKSIDSEKIELALTQPSFAKKTVNVAEQYLLLVAQALLKENAIDRSYDGENSRDIIVLLEQATKLSAQIFEPQLHQPNFLQLHLILAENYAQQGQFDLAYLEKKSYLKKYHSYRKEKRLAMIASLEQSFEVNDKKASNSLLASQNKLKVRRVAEVQDQKATQQYNFTLIISTAIVFMLLFFRQLRIRNKLIRLTRTDALTGLGNRSALFEHGEHMVASFASQPEELSVLLLDLDHFKKINDNFGHHAGDKTLKVISQLVKETMRSRDVFYRLGGEEFVAILPFADCNKAKAIAMRINEKIARHDFSSLIHQSKVTVSIGVATMAPNQLTFEQVLHCADLAMYQAKELGRNSVVCYQNIAQAQERRDN